VRIEKARHLAPTAEGFRNIVRMAYAAGRARGREEAKHKLLGLAESPSPFATPSDNAGPSLGEDPPMDTRLSEDVRYWISAAVGPYDQKLA
jgi:hypothetical protein